MQAKNLILFKLSLCGFLLELSFNVTLLILQILDLVALSLDLALGLKPPLNPGLNLKRVLFKQCQLLHQLVLLLNELLIADRELLCVLSAHQKLCLKLSYLLIEFVSFKLASSIVFNHPSLIFSGVLQRALDMI